jgi:hypothetical protein
MVENGAQLLARQLYGHQTVIGCSTATGCTQPLQIAIEYTQRQTLAPAKLATIQAAAFKLAHDLLDLCRRAPPLPNHTLFVCHGVHFTTEIACWLECGCSDAYQNSSSSAAALTLYY